jgi:hypothetical protein
MSQVPPMILTAKWCDTGAQIGAPNLRALRKGVRHRRPNRRPKSRALRKAVRHRRPNRRAKKGPPLFKVDSATLRFERVDGGKMRLVSVVETISTRLLAGGRLEGVKGET